MQSSCRFRKAESAGANGHQNKDWDWIQDALGATQIARLQARDMSDYMYVLASDEGLRDPQEKWDEIATEREKRKKKEKKKRKMAQWWYLGRVWWQRRIRSGILKRKLSAVHFGSRFSKRGKQETAIVDIDGFGASTV